MACQGGCSCCKGACCNGGTCTQETCDDCEAAGGLWQGAGTECDGTDCPCDPPADHTACERCDAIGAIVRCPSGHYCCYGICSETECCVDTVDCGDGQCCDDGDCIGSEVVTIMEQYILPAGHSCSLSDVEDALEGLGYAYANVDCQVIATDAFGNETVECTGRCCAVLGLPTFVLTPSGCPAVVVRQCALGPNPLP